jgi:hypothetical protein
MNEAETRVKHIVLRLKLVLGFGFTLATGCMSCRDGIRDDISARPGSTSRGCPRKACYSASCTCRRAPRRRQCPCWSCNWKSSRPSRSRKSYGACRSCRSPPITCKPDSSRNRTMGRSSAASRDRRRGTLAGGGDSQRQPLDGRVTAWSGHANLCRLDRLAAARAGHQQASHPATNRGDRPLLCRLRHRRRTAQRTPPSKELNTPERAASVKGRPQPNRVPNQSSLLAAHRSPFQHQAS